MYARTLWIPKEYVTYNIGHGTLSPNPVITSHVIPFTWRINVMETMKVKRTILVLDSLRSGGLGERHLFPFNNIDLGG